MMMMIYFVHLFFGRTNPATRVESWKLDFIEDIHSHHSQDATSKSRASSPWLSEGHRYRPYTINISVSPLPSSRIQEVQMSVVAVSVCLLFFQTRPAKGKFFIGFERLFFLSAVGPFQLAIHVAQNRHTGEQTSHWDKTNKRHT